MNLSRRIIGNLVLPVTAALLSSCSVIIEKADGPPARSVDIASIPDPVPRMEPRSKYGNPESYVVNGKRYYILKNSNGYVDRGIASWYGTKFNGRRTSSGETYNMYAMTAAHKTLPLPTYVKVTNLRNGKAVIVRVNDRGPFHENRIIDLSYTAAAKLDIISTGTGLVEVRAINPATYMIAKNGKNQGNATKPTDSKIGTVDDFYIQVGSFSSLINARRLKSKLDNLGKGMIRISVAVLDGKTMYRVQVGPINKVDKADAIVSVLARYGIKDHHIVIE